MTPTRRNLLIAAGAGAAMLAAGRHFWPEQGLLNPCRAHLPRHLAEDPIVAAAWAGIEPGRVWDCHVHLVGVGDSGGGTWINPRMQSWLHPMQYAQRLFFLNAGCAHQAPGQVDASYMERMHNLVDALAPGTKLILLAFDHAYDEHGERDLDRSAFHTPNDYAADLAERHPRYFEWAASIHPYRADCVEALERAVRRSARAVKWLPPAMGIDPASARCDRFYAAAARLRIPLLTHAGEERAVRGTAAPSLGNPLRLRRALDHGVQVVVAHCASIGTDRDLDQGPNGPMLPSFELFTRLMDEPRYQGRLFGDVSALAQVNRAGAPLKRILERRDWHSRLLNGSDYPLPGILPLYSVPGLIEQGVLAAHTGPLLTSIRAHNPLLFDFVLKRELRSGGSGFAPTVFHTRDFFMSANQATAAR
ncbi:MAG: amidohydrolase family protein [Burkholderiales bacterium]|nr:amidohydrolase family protein [Burkholderiales bacterium]